MDQNQLLKGKEFIEYLMRHNLGKIKSLFQNAPFSLEELFEELEEKSRFDDHALYLVHKASMILLLKIFI